MVPITPLGAGVLNCICTFKNWLCTPLLTCWTQPGKTHCGFTRVAAMISYLTPHCFFLPVSHPFIPFLDKIVTLGWKLWQKVRKILWTPQYWKYLAPLGGKPSHCLGWCEYPNFDLLTSLNLKFCDTWAQNFSVGIQGQKWHKSHSCWLHQLCFSFLVWTGCWTITR